MLLDLTFAIRMWSLRLQHILQPFQRLALFAGFRLGMNCPIKIAFRVFGRAASLAHHMFGHAVYKLIISDVSH
jgi:hypothetical protein